MMREREREVERHTRAAVMCWSCAVKEENTLLPSWNIYTHITYSGKALLFIIWRTDLCLLLFCDHDV